MRERGSGTFPTPAYGHIYEPRARGNSQRVSDRRIENGGGGRGKDKEGGLATHLDLLLPFLIRREPVPVVV
jgi:hypothetical protein